MAYHRPPAAGTAITPMQAIIERILSQHGIPAAKGQIHLQLESSTFEPLVIEKIKVYDCDTNELCWSIMQFYLQNGDVMRDPEIVFDGRTWEPLYFRNDGMAVEHYVYPAHPNHRGGKRQARSDSIKEFCTMWARTLHQQGFDDVRNYYKFGSRRSDTHKLKQIFEPRPADARLIWPDGTRWG